MKKFVQKNKADSVPKKMKKMLEECMNSLKESFPEKFAESTEFGCDVLFEGDDYDTFIVEGFNAAGISTCHVNVKVFDGGKWEMI